MKINIIEEILLAYKKHKSLVEKCNKAKYKIKPEYENIGNLLDSLVEQIKETATINEIDTILKLIDIYKTTKVFWLKEVIVDILNEGYCFNDKNYLQEGKMTELTEEFKEPKVPYPFIPDVPPNFSFDPIPNPLLPDSKKLNTIWCENIPNPDANGITTNVTTSKHNK